MLKIKQRYQYLQQKCKGLLLDNIAHVSAFTYGNAGDTLLPIAIENTWEIVFKNVCWKNIHVHKPLSDRILNRINRSKLLLVGGGGLFLKDTNPNNISGWQWPVSVEDIEKIRVPFVLYAVGYNRFRGQEDFDEIFKTNIQCIAERAEYIGLRNRGSIKRIGEYLPSDLHEKIVYQPCPTTFLSKLHPDLTNYRSKEEFIAVNIAFDRPKLRFGKEIGRVLMDIATALKELSRTINIKYFSHMSSDEYFLPYMDVLDIPYEKVRLNKSTPEKIIMQYARPKLVIGMRGHAQMIPFGCKTPILSLISHDKIKWFLDDVEHPEWGIDLYADDLSEEIVVNAKKLLKSKDAIISAIEEKQNDMLRISLDNVKSLQPYVG